MTLKDSLETARQAPLLYVSPNEIRFQIPAGTEPGAVAIAVQMGLDTDWTFATEVDMSAPGLFPANGNGRSVVAAAAVRSIAASAGQDPVPVFARTPEVVSVCQLT